MYRCLIICASCCALTACERPAPVIVNPHIPAVLRQPVAVPARRVETVNDLAAGYVEARAGLAQANGRIAAVDCILTAAEAGQEAECVTDSR